MATERSRNSFHESYLDIKVSLSLLKANWQAFAKTEIFALGAFVGFIFLTFMFLFINGIFIHPGFIRPRPFRIGARIPFYILVASILVFYAFISSTYGLSHDIILSGDQFTEFEKSFTYFKRHFFSYVFLSIIILWIPIAFELEFHFHNFFEVIPGLRTNELELLLDAFTIYLFQYLLFVLFNLTLPSITSKGNLILAFKENFNILIRFPKRMIASWGIFFIIFSLPSYIFLILVILVVRFIFPSFVILGLIILIIVLSSVILGYPIMSLIATRIYATTKEKINFSDQENK